MTDARHEQANALLGELNRQQGGRLTIFLGAAPGVGKTYAMLTRAQEHKRQGLDVVIGIVETHGRAETEALVAGLEVLPRRVLPYNGHRLEELDLDALLARKPQLALIDELAHTNASGSRHDKRWQDVLELLDAGIDVYTTINIQHLESLNDLVLRITGVRVRETVPDIVFDRLRDIVLVDLPPSELIQRLQQGKVYVPEQAAQALHSFFSPANLTALRELALQTAADRVDNLHREAQTARGGPSVALRRLVLVAIDGRGQSEYLVRVGRRLAERRDAPWQVVFVQTADEMEPEQRGDVDAALTLARRLGGEAAVVRGASVVDALLDHAARLGASSIVIGRTRERPIARMFNRTLTQQLIQRGAHFELTIVSTPEARASARRWRLDEPQSRARMYGLAVVGAALAIAVAGAAEALIGLTDLSMVFIVAVLLIAVRTRMSAAVLAAVLCFLGYNFFFIEPRFTFFIGARQGVVTVLLFLIAALVTGRLASRLRAQLLALRAANAHVTALQQLSRRLALAVDARQAMQATCDVMERALEADVIVQVQSETVASGAHELDQKGRSAADWGMRHQQPSGRYTDTLAGSAWWLLPLPEEMGVLGIRFPEHLKTLSDEHRRLAEAMRDELAQTLQRTRLVRELEDSRISGETERLRSALLASVSHDLRSPLAAIIGAASSLQSYSAQMDATDRNALLDTVRLEGERLDRYIQNLLDMTRLGHGGLSLNRDWIGVDELIGAATSRLSRYESTARFELAIAPNLNAIWVHPALVEQALFNVLENAVRFTPRGRPVRIEASDDPEGRLRIDVCDEGPGIPEAERQRIFDMFYSVERGDRGGGSGLGLTICQGMIGAHGGSVEALPGRSGHGTIIRMTLPRLEPSSSTP
ncbi:histidine kinase [Ahniella affigens]|uniref:histidine kinase n=1 Tax=Ahniella affigens TaxID=2021234 RepID=A0A2P1PSQ4_9GAMM|nr:sensor histidine kinase KdpD [Ahniella affigens]AVP97864.1 histidine kinase [Ahniella affigens]